jgi:3-oxoacyl-[acyl-carrier-protein] synthase II
MATHNTIGSQIALLLQCQGYNQTYAHGAFSFESGLLDALIQSEEEPTKNILLGAIDEITITSHAIEKRFGMFRKTVNGEGAAFFVVNGQRAGSKVCIDSVETLYKPDQAEVKGHLNALGKEYDLVLLGINLAEDILPLRTLCEELFPSASSAYFKHLSGENPVASSFGVWLAATILNTGIIPPAILLKKRPSAIKKILILNRYFDTHYSTISMSAC